MIENEYSILLKNLENELIDINNQIESFQFDIYGDPSDCGEIDIPEEDDLSKLERIERKRDSIKDKIQEINTRIAIEKYNEMYKNQKNKYKRGLIISDKETTTDLLSREIYSKILAEYIANKNTETPFNIGIFGQWGEGKSSFMRLIEEEIINQNNNIENNEKYYTHIVRYDASEYNNQDKIWSAILKRMFDKFENENGFINGRLKFNFNRIRRKFKSNLWKYILSMISLLLFIAWGIFIYIFKNKSIIFYGYTGVIPILILINNTIIPFIKASLKLSKPLSERVLVSMELPNYSKELGLRENIKTDLRDLLDVWLKRLKKDKQYNERIVIFVDELDRCSDKGIIEFLEAMQLFLPVEQIIIVLSITYDSIYHALIQKYDSNNESINKTKKIEFCINYLEKYINIPFFLCHKGDYKRYLDTLLNMSEGNLMHCNDNKNEIAVTDILENTIHEDSLSVFDSEEKDIIGKFLNDINRIKHITPRTIKRILNLLVLSKHICVTYNSIGLYYEKINFQNYIKWFLFSYFSKKTSFKILSIVKKCSFYFTISQIKPQINKDEELKGIMNDELYSKESMKILNEIKVNEILMFSDISEYFIVNETNFRTLLN